MINADEPRLGPSARFDVLRRLGAGGAGVVYEAYDREHGSTVALKTVRVGSPESLLSLKSEFRAVSGLRHPNLVSLGELLEEDGNWFFTMELLQGQPFTEAVRMEQSPFSEPPANAETGGLPRALCDTSRLRAALPQLVEGLRALHGAGFVHRDIKPSNVLVTRDGRVVILDFGIAKHLVHASVEEEVVGTAIYTAPEQALAEGVGEPADWYAVGVVLYEALTGSPPFVGSFHQIVEQKLLQSPRPPSELVSDVPSDLEALCMALLSVDADARPTGEWLERELGLTHHGADAHHEAVLVGRGGELSLLERAYEQVASGRAVTVLVHGESGVGKSFLVNQFTADLSVRHPDLLVLSGRCYERESVPYKAFDGVVDRLARVLSDLADEELFSLLPLSVPLLMRAFPVLRTLADRLPERSLGVDVANPQELRARTFAGVRDLLGRLARGRPVAIVVDDLQWADADSFHLLHEVMRPPDAPTLLFLATVRSGSETRGEGEHSALDVPGDLRQVRLESLTLADATRLAQTLLTRAGVFAATPEQVRAIIDEAKGHPLFIEELVRQRAGGHGEALVRLDDALWQRALRLEPGARRALELVAVAGTPITLEAAALTANVDFAELFQLATKLRAEALLRMSGARRDSQLETYHDRVRESVLGNLAGEVKRDWHLRLATVLEAVADVDEETVALHWLGAGDRARAAGHYVAAAEQAKRALAFERAARLYGLALAEGDYAGVRRRELMRERADALINSNRLAEGADVLLELADDAAPLDRLPLLRMAAQHLVCSGHVERGIELLEKTLRNLGAYNPGSRAALIGSVLFWRFYLSLRGLDMRTDERARRSEKHLMFVDAAWSAGQAYGMNDNLRGVYFHYRGLIASLDAGDPQRSARTLAMMIASVSSRGLSSRPQVAKMLVRERKLAESVATPEALAFLAGGEGFAHINYGEWAEGKLALDRAEMLFRDQCPGSAYEISSVRCLLFRTLFCLGHVEELGRRGEVVLRTATQQNDLYQMLVCQSMAMAPFHTLRHQADEAERAIRWARSQLSHDVVRLQHYWTYTSECHLSLYRGDDPGAAYTRMDALWKGLKRSLLTQVASVRIFTLSLRARAATALARVDRGQASLLLRVAQRDARMLAREPITWGKASGLAIEGAVAMARGEHEPAARTLEQAAVGYSAASMPLHAAAARRVEGELRGGSRGHALVQSADQELVAHGVVDPARATAMLVGEGPASR